MLLADHGLDIYANGIGVKDDFLQKNPEVVRRFVRAALRGWKDALANPEEAAKLQVQYLKALDPEIIAEELQVVKRLAVMPDTQKNGLGWIEQGKLKRTVDFINDNFDVTGKRFSRRADLPVGVPAEGADPPVTLPVAIVGAGPGRSHHGARPEALRHAARSVRGRGSPVHRNQGGHHAVPVARDLAALRRRTDGAQALHAGRRDRRHRPRDQPPRRPGAALGALRARRAFRSSSTCRSRTWSRRSQQRVHRPAAAHRTGSPGSSRSPTASCCISNAERREDFEAAYLLACDGGRSTVREQLGIPVEGKSLPVKYALIDLEVDLDVANPRDYPTSPISPMPKEWMILVRHPHCWRFLFPLPPDRAGADCRGAARQGAVVHRRRRATCASSAR